MFGKKKKIERVDNLMTAGSRGVGTLINVRDTGMTINDNPRVKMILRVDPLDGSARVRGREDGDRLARQWSRRSATATRSSTTHSRPERLHLRRRASTTRTGSANIVAMFGDAFGPDAVGRRHAGDGRTRRPPPPAAEDPLDQLKKLAELRDAGALTDAEFETQKAADPRAPASSSIGVTRRVLLRRGTS